MSQRFFVESPITGNEATLTDAEAQHLVKVMRARAGDEVTLFDGQGSEFTGRIAEVTRSRVTLTVVERRAVNRELPFSLTLAVALPKGDRQKWLVEKLTELGAGRLVPLVTERGVAQPVASALDRLQRGVIEASKQCGRNRLMNIAAPCTVADLAGRDSTNVRLVADPTGQPLATIARQTANLVFAIGPEGGFADEELAAFDRGQWRRAALGPRILRIETAAIAVAAWASLNP